MDGDCAFEALFDTLGTAQNTYQKMDSTDVFVDPVGELNGGGGLLSSLTVQHGLANMSLLLTPRGPLVFSEDAPRWIIDVDGYILSPTIIAQLKRDYTIVTRTVDWLRCVLFAESAILMDDGVVKAVCDYEFHVLIVKSGATCKRFSISVDDVPFSLPVPWNLGTAIKNRCKVSVPFPGGEITFCPASGCGFQPVLSASLGTCQKRSWALVPTNIFIRNSHSNASNPVALALGLVSPPGSALSTEHCNHMHWSQFQEVLFCPDCRLLTIGRRHFVSDRARSLRPAHVRGRYICTPVPETRY